MVQDALAGERLMGMTLLRSEAEKGDTGSPEIYDFGCVARIVNAAALPDGRCHVVLFGFREFEIEERLTDPASYRRARVRLRAEFMREGEALSLPQKQEILTLLEQIGGDKQSGLVERLKDPALDPERWMNLCCFSLPISSVEKLSLLGAQTLAERASCLVNVLHFKVFEKEKPFERLPGLKRRDVPN